MKTGQNLEQLNAWHKARVLVGAIHNVIYENNTKQDWGLAAPMQRAADAILSSIEQGVKEEQHERLHRCLQIARACTTEVRSQLYMAHDLGYIDRGLFDTLIAQASDVSHALDHFAAQQANP